MAYPWVLLILLENILLRGKEGNSLLVHAPITLLLPHFTFLTSLFFCTLYFLSCYISHLFFLTLSDYLSLFLLLSSLCIAKAFLYYLPWWVLPFYPSTTFGLVWVSFPDHPLVCRLPSHHHYLVLAMSHSIPRQKNFVLFPFSPRHFHPDKGWVFFLTNSYGIHLVIPVHLSLFWVVCHFSKTFPPKEFEQEPQNKLPPSPHC